MIHLRRLIAGFRRLLQHDRVDADLDAELREFLKTSVEQKMRAGLTRDAAVRAARLELGSVALIKDRTRDIGWESVVESIWQDVRYAVRMLRRSPGFTAVAMLTLALGIGANTAIFSVVNAVILRPLPYPDSDRLVRFIEHLPPDAGATQGYPQRLASLAAVDVAAFRTQATTLSQVGTYAADSWLLAGPVETIRVQGTRVSPSVFAMLDVQPFAGRTFEPREETPGEDASVVLSHSAWQRYFGGTPDVLDKSLTLDGRQFHVIGVMPQGFQFPDSNTQLWIPFTLRAGTVAPIARLADGVTLEAASAQVAGILRELQARSARSGAKPSTFELESVHEQLVAPVRPALVALAVAVALVLLIACVNVANLLLARTAARRRELAVRAALGAGRGRLARQMLTESLLLACVGAAAGTAVAFGALQLLRALGTSLPRGDLTPGVSIPRLDEISIDPSTLAFTTALTIATGLVFGLAAALRQSFLQPPDALREGSASVPSGFNLLRRHSLQGLIIVAEIAMAMMLLVGGGLVVHSFVKLASVDPGYDSANVLTFTIASGGRQRSATFNDDLVARLESLPGVRAAGYAELMPMVRMRSGGPFRRAQPLPGAAPRRPSPIDIRTVSRNYSRAMGMRILEGRAFGENDAADGTPKLMINRRLARSGYLGPNPVGTLVYPVAPNRAWQVVGIVDDVHQYGLDQEPDAQVFIDARDLPMGNPNPYFAVRAERNPAALVSTIRTTVRQLDANGMVDNIATMEQVVTNSISRPRLYAVLLGLFAGIAAALAAIGIYGVMAYSVAQRSREIGIRTALGATRGKVMRLVLGQSLLLTALGIVLGLIGAGGLVHYLDTMLFGLTPLDPATFATASFIFAAVAALAAYVPARRATRVDPLRALRCE